MITTTEDIERFLKSDEKLSIDALLATRRQMATIGRLRHVFFEALHNFEKQTEREGASPEERLKIGAGWWVLGEPDHAMEVLGHTLSTPVALYITGRAHLQRKEYAEAVDRFEKALAKEPDSTTFQILLAEAFRKMGRTDQARKIVEDLMTTHAKNPDLHYERGILYDSEGLYQEAIAQYEEAIRLDERHGKALFRLACTCDRVGEDEKALEYYKRCCNLQPTFTNALINLGILYEDLGRYDEAMECYRNILNVSPNHQRARMFLKDAKASKNMYYDEEQMREQERREQILRTPVSDFELSVRSRNCLEKMQIRTLGDLISKNEAELLSYKNFGETSLIEIKELLTGRGLTLGQNKLAGAEAAAKHLSDGMREMSDQLLEEPIAKLGLSLRCERAMAALEIRTLGELLATTEEELMTVKNFGKASLNEVKEALKQRGLALKSIAEGQDV